VLRKRYSDRAAAQSGGKRTSRPSRRDRNGGRIRCCRSDRNACDSRAPPSSSPSLARSKLPISEESSSQYSTAARLGRGLVLVILLAGTIPEGSFRHFRFGRGRLAERSPSETKAEEVRSGATPSSGSPASDPRRLTLETHRDYYAAGGYDIARLEWTLTEFLPSPQNLSVLEIGCGDGSMIELLAARGAKAQGTDASSSGIERCLQKGLSAQCLDVSTDGVPFPNDSFDVVISLETFEHLMNPYYALQEVRRVLRPAGRFICSVPNPLIGHPFLYPGLFEYRNFRQFLEQGGFAICRVRPWEWAPRETILPPALRRVPVLNGRLVAGGLRKVIEKSCLALGVFPAFCYWLWTFECQASRVTPSQFEDVSRSTMPGSTRNFSR
jgi:SAM-dependent methyltransferase